MVENEVLAEVGEWLAARNLSQAIATLDGYLIARQQHTDIARLEAIRTDFQLMTDYWKRGFKDPQLASLYDNLLRRLYVLHANVSLAYAVGNSSFLSSIYMRLQMTTRDWSVDGLREALEAHVSEVAILDLEPEHSRTEKRKEIYRRHHQLMSEWFDNVWLSTIWTDDQAEAMEKILLSPTIESNDQQLLVSAMMIACVNFFDASKFRTLIHVYEQSEDEQVRQRAFVGWALCLWNDAPLQFFPEEVKQLEKLLENKAVCEELVALQQQIIFCIHAERDHQTIQNEIMPNLLNNSKFRVTQNGIEEIEDNPLEDILHPDAEERRMEKMEESFLKMQAMQKQGSDIYFGGFSQMKRFPFFKEVCNWFVPFYMEHPQITEMVTQYSDYVFLKRLVSMGPFCNSDKYSFLLAFGQVVSRIPQELRDMMKRGEASVDEMLEEQMQNADFIRRTYLQDTFRFYRLFPQRSDLHNPFDGENCLFFARQVFSRTHLEPYFNDMAAFLLKQQRGDLAGSVLENCGEARRDFRYYMMAGYLAQHLDYVFDDPEDNAVNLYQHALDLEPENERALLGYARALFGMQRYEEALDAYERLLKKQPEKKSYMLNRAVCLTNMQRSTEALKDLYRLNYESPDDANVNRVLAWALTCDEKYEQAEKIYAQLLSEQEQQMDDLLNYGYCLWLGGHADEAADCFHRYLKETGEKKSYVLEHEQELLREKGITEPEMQMMLYIL